MHVCILRVSAPVATFVCLKFARIAFLFFLSSFLSFLPLLFLVHSPPNLAVNQMFTLPCYY